MLGKLRFWRTKHEVQQAYERGLSDALDVEGFPRWMTEYVISPFFLEFVAEQINEEVRDDLDFEPSPQFVALTKRIEEHTPMKGFALLKGERWYILDDESKTW